MKTSDLVVKCLEEEGVKYVFGIPGEETLHLMDSFLASSIRFIPTRHEQGAAFMADVYGRLTGKAGVCLATLGPGATNLLTGVADANMDGAPLVAVTGQSPLTEIHKETHQYIDILQMFQPVTKWNTRLHRGETAPEVIRKAFKIAEQEKPGATHIEIPTDIAGSPVDAGLKPLPRTKVTLGAPDPNQVAKAAEFIRQAKAPIILAGNGVARMRAGQKLVQFAESNNIPVATTFMGKGLIPFPHPLCLSAIGLQAHDVVACGVDRADLIITVGYDYVEYAPRFWNPQKDKTIIHINALPAEVDAYYPTAVELVGDLRLALHALTRATGFAKDSTYSNKLKEIITAELKQHQHNLDFPVTPQKMINDLRTALGKEDILISDVGAHKMWISRLYPAHKPNTVIISNGYAAMGIALPGAIAAKLAKPERKVVAVTGDGGFLMNSQELETAQRLGLSFVVVVVNDGGYGLIKWKQENQFGRVSGVNFSNPDLVSYAASFGCCGYRIKKAEDFFPTLMQSLNKKGIFIIDLPVDYRENLKLTHRLGKYICPL